MASAGQNYGLNTFRWSEKEYSLRELVERFGHMLPFLVVATEGYLGVDDWQGCVATNEIQWLYGFASQERLVVKNKDGVFYSIPRCYEGMVTPTRKDGLVHRKTSISDVMEHGCYTYLEFCDKRMLAKTKGRLKIIETYEEKYLVGHVLVDGKLERNFTLTPCYAPIKLSIALTTTAGGQKTFFSVCMEFNNFADRCPHDYTEALKQFSEVSVFQGKPQAGEYEYISSVPLLLAGQVPEGMTNSKKSGSYTKGMPIAYGIHEEDRLRQLKHVLYTKVIPQDDNAEVTDPEPPAKSKQTEQDKVRLTKSNVFKILSKKRVIGQQEDKAQKETKPKSKPKPKPKPKAEKQQCEHPSAVSTQEPETGVYEKLLDKRSFTSLGQVPRDLTQLSVQDVGRCLDLLHLSRHKKVFQERVVDGSLLTCLTETMLFDEFGFSEFEAMQLSKFVGGYRPKID